LSDIIGILYAHHAAGHPISQDQIDRAVNDLYGSWADILPQTKTFLNAVMSAPNLEKLYKQFLEEETENHDVLIEIQNRNPKMINKDNIDEVLSAAKQKKQKDDITR
jgi:Rad3-related DNA helicase